MSAYTNLGPGTFEITLSGSTAVDFAGELLGYTLAPTYADVGNARTMLNGDKRKAGTRRETDLLTLQAEPDFTADGLYILCQANDMAKATMTITPNDADGHSWSGEIELRVPETEAGEFGGVITGTFTFPATTVLPLTPGPAGP